MKENRNRASRKNAARFTAKMSRLGAVDSRAAEVVKLCYFVGLTQEQAGKALGVSVATAERLWKFARAWLFREMQRNTGCDGVS